MSHYTLLFVPASSFAASLSESKCPFFCTNFGPDSVGCLSPDREYAVFPARARSEEPATAMNLTTCNEVGELGLGPDPHSTSTGMRVYHTAQIPEFKYRTWSYSRAKLRKECLKIFRRATRILQSFYTLSTRDPGRAQSP